VDAADGDSPVFGSAAMPTPGDGRGHGTRPATVGRKRDGWLLTEIVVCLMILGLTAGGLTLAMTTFRKFNRAQWTRRRCVDAAEAQLNSLAATGREIPTAEVQRLWPGIETVIDRREGQGAWTGLTCVKVTARGTVQDRPLKVHLTRYVDEKGRW